MRDLHQQLADCVCGRVCLIGVGNVDYGDDSFGVHLAEELIAAGVSDVVIAGTSPERFVGQITQAGFDHVVFLDAVDFSGEPGSVVLLDSTRIAARFAQISTHKISLGLLAKWIEANAETKAWLLGVQPESLKPSAEQSAESQPLTPALQKTLDVLRELLLDSLSANCFAASASAPSDARVCAKSDRGSTVC